MKIAIPIVAGLLGFVFIAISLMVLLGFAPKPDVVAGSPNDFFLKAFVPTGWMTMVKVLELTGGILVAVPKTRNFGLLILGPIILNILAYHTFIASGVGLFPIPVVIAIMALFLLWAERKAFLGLLH